MFENLPEDLEALLAEKIPNLKLTKLSVMDWMWEHDGYTSEEIFETWKEALVDFIFHLEYKVNDAEAEFERLRELGHSYL